MAGWDIHTTNSQNGGPYIANEIYPGASAHFSTIGAFFADATIAPVEKITLAANSITSPAACAAGGVNCNINVGFLIDENNSKFTSLHCESANICYEVGQDLGSQALVFDTDGAMPVAHPGMTAIDISPNFCSTTSDIS